MRRFSISLTLALFSFLLVKSERILETALEDVSITHRNTIYNGNLLIAGYGNPYLLIYDDERFSRISFPILDGIQLNCVTVYPLINFESSVFITLGRSVTPFRIPELYKYSDRGFTRIPISGTIKSNSVVYGSYLYFLTEVSGTVKLFRYSMGVITEVDRGAIPRSRDYRLKVEGGSLYITGIGGTDGYFNFILRYTGGSFFTITSDLHGPAAYEIFAITGTDRFYFTSQYNVYYFNGRSIVQVFSNSVAAIVAKMIGNDLIFIAATGPRHDPDPTLLYKLSGATLTTLTLPSGHDISTESPYPETFRGSFYFGAFTRDGRAEVLSYDGTSFSTLFTFPTSETFAQFNLILKENELIIQGQIDFYTSRTYSYNGIVTEEIIAPAGRYIYLPKNTSRDRDLIIKSTECNHIWQISNPDAGVSPYDYAKESRGCPVPPPPPPPPPPPGPVAVIPVDFMIHERFEGVAIGRDRGWCWNEIIFGWDPPICDPPCPEPNYQLIMVGENNEIAWAEKFSKPSNFIVPLKDEKAFKTILSSIDNKSDLLIFDPDLVPKGIEEIKLFMLPKKNFITISVTTRKEQTVPLRVALLDENGKEIWMQTFVAPFAMQITATVQKPGKTLVFSIPDTKMNFITKSK